MTDKSQEQSAIVQAPDFPPLFAPGGFKAPSINIPTQNTPYLYAPSGFQAPTINIPTQKNYSNIPLVNRLAA